MLAWGLFLTAVAVLVILSGLAGALRSERPATVLRFMPGDARALANRASETLLLGNATTTSFAQARVDARAALARDATLPVAWRTLALTVPDGSSRSTELLGIAQRLSRRDVPTQLALLELQVRQGNILGALQHYDVILRISTAYDALLFPVLAKASAEPQIRQPLARRLLEAPMWRRRFLAYMIAAGTSYDVEANLFSAMAAAGALPDRDIVAMQATSSALGGQYAIAEQLYRLVAPSEAAKVLRDGEFQKDGSGVPPFDWQLDTDGAVDVAVTGQRLEISSRRGDGGQAARQLVSLSPGRHRITVRFGAIDSETAGIPYASVTCADAGTSITTLNGVPGRARFSGDIIVPANCRFQWLALGLRQDLNGSASAAWIDNVTVD